MKNIFANCTAPHWQESAACVARPFIKTNAKFPIRAESIFSLLPGVQIVGQQEPGDGSLEKKTPSKKNNKYYNTPKYTFIYSRAQQAEISKKEHYDNTSVWAAQAYQNIFDNNNFALRRPATWIYIYISTLHI